MAATRTPESILERPASVAGLRLLLRAGAIDDARLHALSERLHPAGFWLRAARLFLLGFGAALVLAGVIYLLAFNWEELGRFTRLGLPAAGIALCLVAAAVRGRARLTGKVLVLAAVVLIGAFLAVFGQVYQTGADAYELFVAWALLSLGWVLVTDFAALWFLWLLLVDVAVILYWDQVAEPAGELTLELLLVPLAGGNAAAMALREAGARRGIRWLQESWVRYAQLTATLVLLTWPALVWIVTREDRAPDASWLAGLAWLVGAGALCGYWRLVVPDLRCLALLALDACLVVVVLVATRLAFADVDPAGTFLLTGVVALLAFTGAVWALRRVHQAMQAEEGTE